jgi:DnaD/phage-associated family protein
MPVATKLAFEAGSTKEEHTQFIKSCLDSGMSVELIKLGISKKREKPGAKWNYLQSILNSWKDQGFTTLEDGKNEWKRGENPEKARRSAPIPSGEDDYSNLVLRDSST